MDRRPPARVTTIGVDQFEAAPDVLLLTIHAINADGIRLACQFMLETRSATEFYRSARRFRGPRPRTAPASSKCGYATGAQCTCPSCGHTAPKAAAAC